MFEEIRDPKERVKSLSKYASDIVEVDVKIPVSRYFRSGKEMIRMAVVYNEEGDLESAFILYFKIMTILCTILHISNVIHFMQIHFSLFIEKLPKHPNYTNYSPVEIDKNKEILRKIFPVTETIKNKLILKYTNIEEKRKDEEKKLLEQSKAMDAFQKMEEEKRRRQEEEERVRLKEFEQALLERHLQDLQRQKEDEILKLQNLKILNTKSLEDNSTIVTSLPQNIVSDFTPSLPEICIKPVIVEPVVPDRTLKPVTITTNIKPIVDRNLKPSNNLTDVGGSALKTIYIPLNLTEKFLELSKANTRNNIESCGILCGRLERGTWRMSHMLMPKQHGQSDSCDVDNEEDLVEVQDQHNLITLGWIHTHPTQTAFLSSVDQHTQWPYQKLLPEAIAIVCAPTCNEIGYFNLTIPYGMDLIQNCRGVGFHEHPQLNPIYESCNHIKLDSATSVTVIDMR